MKNSLRTIGFAILAFAITTSARAQTTNFSTDVSTAIDRSLEFMASQGGFTGSYGDATGLAVLALLEKRQDASQNAVSQGFADASSTDKARITSGIDYLIANVNNGFYAYRVGQEMMALSIYLRSGGFAQPNGPAALTALNVAFDSAYGQVIAGHGTVAAWHGYWCYTNAGCPDSSTTQFVISGLAAAKAVYADVSFSDPGRLATVDALLARSGDAYAAKGSPGQCTGTGDGLTTTERGHPYNADATNCSFVDGWGWQSTDLGRANSQQQTASGTWIQLAGGRDLHDPSVQGYLEWARNRYSYTNLVAPGAWPTGPYGYYLWSSAKAYTFLEDSGLLPTGSELSTASLGVLPPGDGPAYAARQMHLDPAAVSRPTVFGSDGVGYYNQPEEPARWYFDYAHTLISRQAANGQWSGDFTGDGYSDAFNQNAEQAYYTLVLQRSVGGGCLDGDDDGVCDSEDICPANPDPDQEDADGDLLGDACDACANDPDNDADQDGVCGDVDACPLDPNNDADGDGICGDIDTCPLDPNNDADADGVCGDVDNCPLVSNPGQEDNNGINDGVGAGDACENQAPVCAVPAGFITLWPPNHQLVPISIPGISDPDGDSLTVTATSITQDEPRTGSGQGAGNTPYDATLSPVQVRAERNGNPKTPGNGRVYHLSVTATDPSGASCQATALVCVPHDQRPGATCVDGGPLFNSVGP